MATSASSPHPGTFAATGGTEVQHYLQRIKLFSALTPEQCDRVVKRMKRRDYAPRMAIVREGAAGNNAMFFITTGLVEIRRKDPHSGIEFLLTEMGPGQNFGEMSLLTGKPRSATVTAVQPTTCAILEQPDFQDLLLQYPPMGLALTTILAERLESVSHQVGVEFMNLAKTHLDARVVSLLPQQMMQQHRLIPVAFCNNRMTVAMVNPSNLVALDDIRRIISGVMVEPVVITEDDFKNFMTTSYPQLMVKQGEAEKATAAIASAGESSIADLESTMDTLQSDLIRDLQLSEDNVETKDSKQELMNASEDAPIIRLANSILGLAIKRGASDIHIEPQENDLRVRYRMDGVLQVAQVLPKKVQLGLISRLKIVARLDISEKRLPQDGRISVSMEGRPIDFRVSSIPGKWGEKIVMRILDKANTMLGLDKLIGHEPVLKMVRELIAEPYGIMYVTGPTGSGKTTTLYSALSEINDIGVNISTAEDPIEYDLAGINQIQVNSDIGLDFARVLRSFLRQDPDIILVGETRDKETAHISVEAALTGHLVFTTLHTNSAAGAFTRLFEMGIEPFLVSSSTLGVMAQRLARRLCKACKESYVADDPTCDYVGIPRGSTLYKQRGCDACNGSGFKGRVGIYEVMKMNPELRTLVGKGGNTDEIYKCAMKSGMIDLKHYAGIMLREGATSVEEVLQVVSMQD